MKQLEGKLAVVTGGATGIGYAVAERFAQAGAETVIFGRTLERLEEAAKKIGHGTRAVAADMGEEDQVRALFADLERVDILVTCAGGAVFGDIETLPPSEWKRLFHGRFFGQIYCCHYAIPKMPEGGVILLCSGIAADAHVDHYAGGAALCGAVNGMGKALAVDLAKRGLRVNVLSPGLIFGTQIKTNLEGEDVGDFVRSSIAAVPMGNPGKPEDMADAAMFLVTCEYVNGQVIDVDGGWTAT